MATTNKISGSSESYTSLFMRFLRFGLLAWGGPIAQIDMIRQELVDEKKWVTREKFNRVLGTYQALPGPEANELCVHFGMLARGRLGGLVAGLGFMLPGFVLMFLLSIFYVKFGIASPLIAALFYGLQPGVIALIVRALYRIGKNAITNRWLLGVAILSSVLNFLGVHFIFTLLLAALLYILLKRNQKTIAISLCLLAIVSLFFFSNLSKLNGMSSPSEVVETRIPSNTEVMTSGFRTGLLTFGGAYTAIPFLHNDVVEVGRWITNKQFLDGIALSGILPAPFIIFATFIGYISAGILGALLMTIGIFVPAFGFTLIGYNYIEKISENKQIHDFLDGLTAGVVGLMAIVTVRLIPQAISDLARLGIFAVVFFILYKWKAKIAVPGAMLVAGLLGIMFSL